MTQFLAQSVQAMSFDFPVIHAGALLRIDGMLYLKHIHMKPNNQCV